MQKVIPYETVTYVLIVFSIEIFTVLSQIYEIMYKHLNYRYPQLLADNKYRHEVFWEFQENVLNILF